MNPTERTIDMMIADFESAYGHHFTKSERAEVEKGIKSEMTNADRFNAERAKRGLDPIGSLDRSGPNRAMPKPSQDEAGYLAAMREKVGVPAFEDSPEYKQRMGEGRRQEFAEPVRARANTLPSDTTRDTVDRTLRGVGVPENISMRAGQAASVIPQIAGFDMATEAGRNIGAGIRERDGGKFSTGAAGAAMLALPMMTPVRGAVGGALLGGVGAAALGDPNRPGYEAGIGMGTAFGGALGYGAGRLTSRGGPGSGPPQPTGMGSASAPSSMITPGTGAPMPFTVAENAFNRAEFNKPYLSPAQGNAFLTAPTVASRHADRNNPNLRPANLYERGGAIGPVEGNPMVARSIPPLKGPGVAEMEQQRAQDAFREAALQRDMIRPKLPSGEYGISPAERRLQLRMDQNIDADVRNLFGQAKDNLAPVPQQLRQFAEFITDASRQYTPQQIADSLQRTGYNLEPFARHWNLQNRASGGQFAPLSPSGRAFFEAVRERQRAAAQNQPAPNANQQRPYLGDAP